MDIGVRAIVAMIINSCLGRKPGGLLSKWVSFRARRVPLSFLSERSESRNRTPPRSRSSARRSVPLHPQLKSRKLWGQHPTVHGAATLLGPPQAPRLRVTVQFESDGNSKQDFTRSLAATNCTAESPCVAATGLFGLAEGGGRFVGAASLDVATGHACCVVRRRFHAEGVAMDAQRTRQREVGEQPCDGRRRERA